MFKITGLDELEKQLDKLSQAADELDGEHSVSFGVLFNPEFMSRNTQFQTIDEFTERSSFDFSDIESIDEAQLDKFIAEHTSFESWEDMKASAAQEWAAKKLGF